MPRSRDYMIASHRSAERGHRLQLEALALDPRNVQVLCNLGAAYGSRRCPNNQRSTPAWTTLRPLAATTATTATSVTPSGEDGATLPTTG